MWVQANEIQKVSPRAGLILLIARAAEGVEVIRAVTPAVPCTAARVRGPVRAVAVEHDVRARGLARAGGGVVSADAPSEHSGGTSPCRSVAAPHFVIIARIFTCVITWVTGVATK